MNEDDTRRKPLDLVSESLDQTANARDLANLAGYSLAQHHRKIKGLNPDPPMTLRRRRRLERAAYRLTRQNDSITEVAFDAGFESLEGFSRCFKAHFGVSPRKYRTLRPSDYRIDIGERIHYAPPAGPTPIHREKEQAMKPYQLLLAHHCVSMERILDRCNGLTDEFHRPLNAKNPFPWEDGQETIFGLLQALIGFADPWLETLNGFRPEYDETTIDGLKDGLVKSRRHWDVLVSKIDEENRWDLTFVDSLCDPPEVFSIVGVVGHVITFNAYRRVLLINELKKIGIGDLGFGDPLEIGSIEQEGSKPD